MENTVKFFLGANSDSGFMSYFKQLQECEALQLLILKGGPGSGKSSLMKRVGEYAIRNGHILEIVPCASDLDSYDAIIDKTVNFAMIDGTAPHTEDPLLPGAKHHIMYTGDLWNTDKLKEKTSEIEFYSNLTSRFHRDAHSYIKAAGALLRENHSFSSLYVLPEAKQFVLETMSDLPEEDKYAEEKKLLSAVTVEKIGFLEETLPLMADDVYVIEDEWGGASDAIFDTVRTVAALKNMRIISCPCSVMPDKTDHIIIPGARVAFSKGNRFFKSSYGQKINADVFYGSGLDRLSCEKRVQDAKKLIARAGSFVKAAKKSHDSLEKFYIKAMDFGGMEELFEKIIRKFYR